MRKKYKDKVEVTETLGGAKHVVGSNVGGSYIVNMPEGLPVVNMRDSEGNVYQANTFFGPMPNSRPVAVPVPSQHVQLTPIVAPMTIVPYISQDQPLYLYDED